MDVEGKIVLLDFSADWCGPCQSMEPVLDRLADRLKDDISIVKIDVDLNPQVALNFNVKSVPTFILIQNGETLWRHSGIATAREMETIIKRHL